MSDFRRRLMICKKSESELPKGYTKLNYLESTGNQYIDTDILSNNDSGCEMRFQYTDATSTTQYAIGSLEVNTARFSPLFIEPNKNASIKSAFYYTNTINLQRKFYANEADTDIHFIKYNCDGSGIIIFDDINCGKVEEIGNSTKTTIYLFARHYNGVNYPSKIKIYKCIIYEKGRKVRNFMPALDSSGKPCMFDTISKKPFYNQGKGEFLYG